VKHILLAATALLGASVAAQAAPVTIAAFGQPTGAANGLTLAPIAGDTASTLTMTDVAVMFTAYAGGPVITGIMDLTANSVSQAVSLLNQVGQAFSGSFCITSQNGCQGTNFISGTFTDAAFGTNGGTDLTVNVSDPTETLVLSSSLIPASQLGTPNAFSLSLVTGSGPLGILGSGSTTTLGNTTLGSDGSITYFATGDVSASDAPAPEPASIALLGVGLLGVCFVSSRKRSI
jgi:hypothetical protein